MERFLVIFNLIVDIWFYYFIFKLMIIIYNSYVKDLNDKKINLWYILFIGEIFLEKLMM